MTKLLSGCMNNTKWREFFFNISKLPVYLQLKLVEDHDFHIDYEQSNWIISDIENTKFVYVKREIQFKEIYAARICKSVIPSEGTISSVQEAIEMAKSIGEIQSSEDNDSFEIYGYL